MLFEDKKGLVDNILKNYKSWHPFPKYEEREAWESLSEKTKKEFVEEAELYHGKSMEWTIIPATRWMAAGRRGDSSIYNSLIDKKRRLLGVLVIAECITGTGRYIDDIFDAAVMIAEFGAWNFPPNTIKREEPFYDALKPRVDLQVGEFAALISLTVYLLGDKLSEISSYIVPQLNAAVRKFMIEPMLNIQYDYFWLGKNAYNNWAPWVSGNLMLSTFLVGAKDDEIRTIMDIVFETLETYYGNMHDDCGSLEGVAYWGHSGGSFLNALEMIFDVSGGKSNIFEDEKIKRIPKFIFDLQLVDNYCFNYGDADAKSIAHCDLLYRYAKKIKDDNLKNFALHQIDRFGYVAHKSSYFKDTLNAIFDHAQIIKEEIGPYEKKDVYYDQSKFLIARTNGENKLTLAAKAGWIWASHRHQDVGNFLLLKGNKPIFIDVGMEVYNSKTFTEEHFSIWCTQSSWHNLPDINGAMQLIQDDNPTVNKIEMDDKHVEFEVEMSKIYLPEAKAKEYKRNIKFDKEAAVLSVTDIITFEKGTKNKVEFHYMTATKPEIKDDGLVIGDFANVQFKTKNEYKLRIEDVKLEDKRLIRNWGDMVYRVCVEVNDIDFIEFEMIAK